MLVKQAFLGVPVVVEVTMVVKVIMGEVRKYSAIKFDAFDAALIERVGRDLHGHVLRACRLHIRKEPLDVGRLRGRGLSFEYLPVVPVCDGTHDAHTLAGRTKNRLYDVRD